MEHLLNEIVIGDDHSFPSGGQEGFGHYLAKNNITYIHLETRLQVGSSDQCRGWVLFISSIISELETLLYVVIPTLKDFDVPFSIVSDSAVADLVLSGKEGYENVGKLITVYPTSEEQVSKIAPALVKCTTKFKGPDVGGTYYLGGTIYTVYQGNLSEKTTVPGECSQLPDWIRSLIAKLPCNGKRVSYGVLNGRYKPLEVLKSDIKGRVTKGIYLKYGFWPAYCAIKEGRKNMWSDWEGRDICDRLLWQYEAAKALSKRLLVPEPLDIFQEYKHAYLITRYVKGVSLDHALAAFFKKDTWLTLPRLIKLRILHYFQDILAIVEILHHNGFVHRDLAPGNFIVQSNGQIWLIDLEICYSLSQEKPIPPFRLGSPGFVSPEQYDSRKPTFKEDVYALGALLLYCITGTAPLKIGLTKENYSIQILTIAQNVQMAELIEICLDLNGDRRPHLKDVITMTKEIISSM